MPKKSVKPKVEKKVEKKVLVVSGTRKRSLAKAVIREGKGIIKVNKKPIEIFPYFHKLSLKEPLIITEKITPLNFDINVNVRGGGVESQIEASRLAISRAIVNFTKNQQVKQALLNYDRNLLVADTRRKEQRKPNRSKARAKRQKSYR